LRLSQQPHPEQETTAKEHLGPKKKEYTVFPAVPPGKSTLELPPTFISNYEASQKKAYRFQKREAAIARLNYRTQNSLKSAAWFTFVAAVIYAAISFGQWYELRRNFMIDERAWLRFGLVPSFDTTS
jgi:hypothetical protein